MPLPTRGRLVLLISLLFLPSIGCGDKDEHDTECEEGAFQCTDDEVLQECDGHDGWVDAEDCAAQNLMCHAEMGHCMASTE